MNIIKFGVWGFGRMGRQHARFYGMEKEKFELVAVCDTAEGCREIADKDFNVKAYSDSKAFLTDQEMEMVVISTLSLDHTKHAVEALEAGKYVLLDKPIAITDEELETLRQADKKYPGKLSVLHNLRFESGFEAIQEKVSKEILGEINMIKIRRHHTMHYVRSDWQTLLEYGGGLLNNWGNHDIDHAVQLLGSHAVDIWSKLWHVSAGGNGDDHVKILLKGDNNRVADIEISYNVMQPEPYCTVYGQRGTLTCNAEMNELTLKYIDPEYSVPELVVETDTAVYSTPLDKDIPWIEEKIKVASVGNMWEYIDRKLIKYLYDQIKNGVQSPIKNSDAFETVRIMQKVKKQNPDFDWLV